MQDDTRVPLTVETFSITVFEPDDCRDPSNGPNNENCGTGECLDEVEFDQSFVCNCTGTGFTGDNCDVIIAAAVAGAAADNTITFAVSGVLAVALILGVLFLWQRRQAALAARKPFDFEAEVEV